MWIFADRLKQYEPECHISSGDFSVETVRLYSVSDKMNASTLYIGRQEDFFPTGTDFIVCKNKEDTICLKTTDLKDVMNQVLIIIELFTRWENGIMELLSAGAMAQDLFQGSLHIFSHPMFLLDQDQHLLAYSSNYKIGEVNEQWDAMLSLGSSRPDYIVQINEKYPQRFSYKGVFPSRHELYPDQLYEYNFFVRDNWVGIAAIIDRFSDLSQGEIDCFSLFCKYLEHWFQNYIQEHHSLLLESQLQTAVSDPGCDLSDLRNRLTQKGWKTTDELIFIKLDAPFMPYNINQHLYHTLRIKFPDVCIFTAELSVCMLCNISQDNPAQLKSRLLPLLNNSRYYATIGQPFSISDSFYNNYKYTYLASDYCEKQVGNIYDADHYTLPYLMAEIKQNVSFELMHPILKKLNDYDAEHGTDFYQTLYVYIKNERSPLATAKELNLHRNTLSYRLKRLSELFQTDLDNPQVRFHLLLSFELSNHSHHGTEKQ